MGERRRALSSTPIVSQLASLAARDPPIAPEISRSTPLESFVAGYVCYVIQTLDNCALNGLGMWDGVSRTVLFLFFAVLHLPFNDVYDDWVSDSSINSNDGITHGCVQVNHGKLATRMMGCAPYVRMNSGYITLSGNHFRGKPMHGVTMAVWVKLSSVSGDHSIFCTISGKASTHTWGQYHFEVNSGKVHWFHCKIGRAHV